MSNNVKIENRSTLNEAREQARQLADEVGFAAMFPITVFKQGSRNFISTVFSVHYIVRNLKANSTERDKGVKDVRLAMNRPLDIPHARVTKEYIKQNFRDKYILPPMTLNIKDDVRVFTVDLPGTHTTPGYMVVPDTVKFSITDGQHRQKALEDLSKELSGEEYDQLKNDGIPVMITIENNIDQIHQDFADCSKTKPLPKSLIAVYDKRNPANGLVLELITSCPLFKDKVDATRSNLSRKSTKLLLVSQVRAFIKELTGSGSAAGDADFEARMEEKYSDANSAIYKEDLTKFRDFVNELTKKIPALQTVASLKGEGIAMSQIPELRSKWLILNSAGLNIVGRIASEAFQKEATPQMITKLIEALSKLDWNKTADIWKGNIVQKGARGLKISTSNSTLKQAVEKVKLEIGFNDIVDKKELELFQ